MKKRKKKNGFEKREELAKFGYWDDKRWKEVTKLRDEGKEREANTLVFTIRESWGL